jgi:hypothetical protein
MPRIKILGKPREREEKLAGFTAVTRKEFGVEANELIAPSGNKKVAVFMTDMNDIGHIFMGSGDTSNFPDIPDNAHSLVLSSAYSDIMHGIGYGRSSIILSASRNLHSIYLTSMSGLDYAGIAMNPEMGEVGPLVGLVLITGKAMKVPVNSAGLPETYPGGGYIYYDPTENEGVGALKWVDNNGNVHVIPTP